jgi:hypothetical protein
LLDHREKRIAEKDVGTLEPGSSEEREIRTERLPAVIGAPADTHVNHRKKNYTETGSEIVGYAGKFQSLADVRDSNFTPSLRERVIQSIKEHGVGHRWLHLQDAYTAERTPSPAHVRQMKCLQRRLEGHTSDGPPDFSSLESSGEWLDWIETTVDVYADEASGPYPDRRKKAETIPHPIRRDLLDTYWGNQRDYLKTRRYTTLKEWKKIVSSLEGLAEPTTPPCDEDHVLCEPHDAPKRGGCRQGGISAYYQFDPERITDGTNSTVSEGREKLYWVDKSLVVLEWNWEGV